MQGPVGEGFCGTGSLLQTWMRGNSSTVHPHEQSAMPRMPSPKRRWKWCPTYQLCFSSIQPQLCCCHLPCAQLVFQPLHSDIVQLLVFISNLQEEQRQATGTLGPLKRHTKRTMSQWKKESKKFPCSFSTFHHTTDLFYVSFSICYPGQG